ncbi:hypothetical protein N7449_004038 [Penicillium cf. viridicatum]|uniref:Uncharacterized protein n=1 Tax=Penicillium cf. viridicatum TaxID=2972119 RepID=A0A9W9T4X6_9EURO|nr:hypothetical protein N7449_004038 [Penicillium cf. viridicatum]
MSWSWMFVCDRMYVFVSKKRQSMPVKARPREPKAKAKVKGAVFIAATLPYHPSALSTSTSFFFEKNETCECKEEEEDDDDNRDGDVALNHVGWRRPADRGREGASIVVKQI